MSLVSNFYGKKRYSKLSLLSQLKLFTARYKDRLSSKWLIILFVFKRYKVNIKALRIPEDKITIIYRGRHFRNYSYSPEEVNSLKKKFSLENQTVVLNLGRLIKIKGQLDLVQSLKINLKKHPGIVLLIAGEGPLRCELETRIKKLGLERNVFLLGYKEDVPTLLALSNCFVFPSYYEGLPGALIEAIIAKKPSIVSDIPENRECFNENGPLYFSPGNVGALSLKMEEAMKVKDWEERLESSFRYAQKNFKVENISKQYENFYRSILG